MSDDTRTTFARWRAGLGLSQAQAAEALGMTATMIGFYERGRNQRGAPVAPDRRMLLAMAAISAGLAPWDDERERVAAVIAGGEHDSRRKPQAVWYRGRWIVTHPELPVIVYDPATGAADVL